MARNRQFYEDVMDVALRATLKEFGFKRKSHATYIMERPERRWIFELESEPRFGNGFEAFAAVYVPALDAMLEKYAPGFRVQRAPIRARAHVLAYIQQLMEIAEGHDFYTRSGYRASKKMAKAYKAAQSGPVMKYQLNGWWSLPSHPMIGRPERDDEEFDEDEYYRIAWDHINELGRFLDKQWRAYIPAWYESCDDPLFLADWIEHRTFNVITRGCTLGVLRHMGGDDQRAAGFFNEALREGAISYEERYRSLHREYRGSWLKQLWLGGGWSEEKVESIARGRFKNYRNAAEAARRLANGLGIAL